MEYDAYKGKIVSGLEKQAIVRRKERLAELEAMGDPKTNQSPIPLEDVHTLGTVTIIEEDVDEPSQESKEDNNKQAADINIDADSNGKSLDDEPTNIPKIDQKRAAPGCPIPKKVFEKDDLEEEDFYQGD